MKVCSVLVLELSGLPAALPLEKGGLRTSDIPALPVIPAKAGISLLRRDSMIALCPRLQPGAFSRSVIPAKAGISVPTKDSFFTHCPLLRPGVFSLLEIPALRPE